MENIFTAIKELDSGSIVQCENTGCFFRKKQDEKGFYLEMSENKDFSGEKYESDFNFTKEEIQSKWRILSDDISGLILTRLKGQSIIINDNIKIKILSIIKNQIKLHIQAPPEVSVHREEIHQRIQYENGVINEILEK